MKDFLNQWDNSSKKQRNIILQRFIQYFKTNMNGTLMCQLEKELGEVTPLFFSRITSSFQMNHTKMDSVLNHIECIAIYFSSQNYKQYIERFIHCGGIQLLFHVLDNRKNHPDSQLQNKCLLIIKLIIKSNCNYKEIICMTGGIETLLDIIVSQTNHDVLYSVYDLLKQLCIRNEAYTPTIHQLIIDYIQQNLCNHEAIKTLLKILQSTLSFDDDVRITLAVQHQNETIVSENEVAYDEPDVMNSYNIKGIVQLLELQNHQIIHELQNLCNVVLRSCKAQIVLFKCLVDLITEATTDLKTQYIQFTQTLISHNREILTQDTKQIFNENKLDELYKLCDVINAFNI